MKHMLAIALLLGAGTVACKSQQNETKYEVTDAQTVTLDITGMT